MRYREIAQKLRALGCEEIARRSGGSHRKWTNPAQGRSSVVPDWGSRDLKLGTVRAAVRQPGLEWESFERT